MIFQNQTYLPNKFFFYKVALVSSIETYGAVWQITLVHQGCCHGNYVYSFSLILWCFYFSNRKRLRASEFVAGNKDQLETLAKMGISVITMTDGRVQLLHTASEVSREQMLYLLYLLAYMFLAQH